MELQWWAKLSRNLSRFKNSLMIAWYTNHCKRSFNTKIYIDRACSSFPAWTTLCANIVSGEDPVGSIARQIRAEYRKVNDDDDISDDDIDKMLNKPESERKTHPYVAVI